MGTKTKTSSIFLILICTLFASCAQILYKIGTNKMSYYYILGGLFLYGIGAVLMIIALRSGEVSVLYPIIATSYVWVLLMSNYFFNEPLNILKIIGVAAIIMGISSIAYGSSKDSAIIYEEPI